MSTSRFAIMHAPRVGSTMLGTILNNHPAVLCHNEIFNVEVIGYAHNMLAPANPTKAQQDKLVMGYAQSAEPQGIDLGSIEARDADPVAFLDKLWSRNLGHKLVGLQMCWRQNEQAYQALIADTGVKKIILRRRNRIKFFVSWQIALKTRQWWVYNKDTLLENKPQVEVTLEALHKYLKHNASYYEELESSLKETAQPFLALDYEDLELHSTRERLLDFLDLDDSGDLSPVSVKQNSRDLRELIANYDDFSREIRGTEFEAELHSLEN